MSNKLYEFMSPERGQIVVESARDGKNLYMSGIFIQGEVRNQNQRIYPLNEIQAAVTAVEDRVRKGETILGELDHPEELSINLDRVSHIIEGMWMEGNDGHGKLKVIGTPMGQIVRNLLEGGAKLGVSSRGSGNVDGAGNVSDFEIVTVDVVAQPSAPDAFPKTIYESLFNMRGGARVFETAKELSQSHSTPSQTRKHLKQDILRLIDELGKQ